MNPGPYFYPPGYPIYSNPTLPASGSSSTEFVKPKSTKIQIIDPNTKSEVDLTESTTHAVPTQEEKQDETPSPVEIIKPTKHAAVIITAPGEKLPEPPKEVEETKPEEQKEPVIATTETIPSEPSTPLEEETTEELSTSQTNVNESGIDEDKVVKEDPSEIEGVEDSEDEDQNEGQEDEEEEGEETKAKIYSRDILLKFKDQCTEPPQALRNLEIFQSSKDKPTMGTAGFGRTGGIPSGGRGRGTGGISPGGRGRGTGGRGRGGYDGPISPGGGRGRGKGTGPRKPGSREPVEKLVKSQNALKVSKDKSDGEKIVDDVKFILNRLTPEKYDKLKSEFLVTCTKLPGDEKVLTDIIDQIFSYAINLQNFSALYARLCADLSSELKEKIGEENTKQFKRLLLNKCQKEFEQEKKDELEKNTAALDLKPEEIEEKEFMLRKKKVGNMIFIGELYLQDMLSERIMHEVIKRLLVNPVPLPSSDDIELLCRLLTTIGKKLDHEKSKKYVNFYFGKMETLSQDAANLASRLRFMLRDVIDMRNNNWVARMEKTKATKTRQEAREEAVKQQQDQIKKLEKHHHIRKTGNSKPKPAPTSYKQSGLQAQRYKMMDSKKPNLVPGGGSTVKATSGSSQSAGNNAFAALLDNEEPEIEPEIEEPEETEEPVVSEPEQAEVTEEEITAITEKTKKCMSNYFEEGEVDETIESILKESLNKSEYFIRASVFAACESSSDSNLGDTVKLYKKLKESGEDVFGEEVVIDGFIRFFLMVVEEEIYFDIPEIFSCSGKLLGRLIFEKVITYNSLFDVLLTVILDEDTPLKESQLLEILSAMYSTIKDECSFDDVLKKPVQQFEEELENPLLLTDVPEGKYLVNDKMNIMSLFKPNSPEFSKFSNLVEEKGYGCFEPSIYFNSKVNNKEQDLSDYIEILSIAQVISGIFHSTLNDNPVDNIEQNKTALEEIRDKLEENDEITILGESQYVCFVRSKFELIKPILEKLETLGLLKKEQIEDYTSGKITVDQPGFEQVKDFL